MIDVLKLEGNVTSYHHCIHDMLAAAKKPSKQHTCAADEAAHLATKGLSSHQFWHMALVILVLGCQLENLSVIDHQNVDQHPFTSPSEGTLHLYPSHTPSSLDPTVHMTQKANICFAAQQRTSTAYFHYSNTT